MSAQSDGNPRAISVRIRGRTKSQATGQRRHDFRIGKQPDYVDPARSHLNSVGSEGRSLTVIADEIEQLRRQAGAKRRLRSDAAIITAGIVTFGTEAQAELEQLPDEQQDDAFEKVAEAIAARFDTTLESIAVHRDESALHAHFELRGYSGAGTPLSKLATPAALSELQDLAATTIQQFCPHIERGHHKAARLAAGARQADVVNRSVKELHADLPREIDAARQRVAELQAEIGEYEAKAETHRARIADLKARETRTAAEEKRLATYEKRLENTQATISERENILSEQELALKAAKERTSEWQQRLEGTETAFIFRENTLKRKEAALKASEERANDRHKRLGETEADLVQRENTLQEQESALQTRQARISDNEIQLSSRMKEIDLKEKEVEEDKNKVKEALSTATNIVKSFSSIISGIISGDIYLNRERKYVNIDPDDRAIILPFSKTITPIINNVRKWRDDLYEYMETMDSQMKQHIEKEIREKTSFRSTEFNDHIDELAKQLLPPAPRKERERGKPGDDDSPGM